MTTNQVTANKESWKQAFLILGHVMVVVPAVIGFGALILVFNVDDVYWKTMLSAISSIGFGVAINYYSFYFKDNTKYNDLLTKLTDMDKETAILQKELELFAKNSVNILKTMSLNIVERSNDENRQMNTFEKRQLADIEQLIRSYESYSKPNFDSYLSDYIRMPNDAAESPQYKNYTTLFSMHGLLNEATGSATLNDAVLRQNDPNRFGGSGGTSTFIFRNPPPANDPNA